MSQHKTWREAVNDVTTAVHKANPNTQNLPHHPYFYLACHWHMQPDGTRYVHTKITHQLQRKPQDPSVFNDGVYNERELMDVYQRITDNAATFKTTYLMLGKLDTKDDSYRKKLNIVINLLLDYHEYMANISISDTLQETEKLMWPALLMQQDTALKYTV